VIDALDAHSSKLLIKPVDAVAIHHNDLRRFDLIVTDNRFICHAPGHVIDLAPYFWGIYHCARLMDSVARPGRRFNCLMNRVSGERQRLLYMLADRDLLDQGHVGFNCLYHDRDPSIEQRRDNFRRVRQECGWTDYQDVHDRLHAVVPLLLDIDPDQAALDSRITVVVESYVSDWLIAVSEKIFRALQTPRPWVLYCSPGTVALLRDTGFDVLDDLVDHARYDSICNPDQRMAAMLDCMYDHGTDTVRQAQAADHNRDLLAELWTQLPDHVAHCRQSILDWHQAISN